MSSGKEEKANPEALLVRVTEGFLRKNCTQGKMSQASGKLYVAAGDGQRDQLLEKLKIQLSPWQLTNIDLAQPIIELSGKDYPIWIITLPSLDPSLMKRNGGKLSPSPYAQSRDLVGAALDKIFDSPLESLAIQFLDKSTKISTGALVGIELAAYTFKRAFADGYPSLKIFIEDLPEKSLQEAIAIGTGINIARHLVNLPPNILYPASYAEEVSKLFADIPEIKAEIWDELRLAEENMNLMLAVGGASALQPRLLKLRYRPKGQDKPEASPLVLVGKGITFDSGGLDLKSASSMRLMKKDMGGSAAIVGAFYSLVHDDCKLPMDIYLPLAENAVSGEAFRPSDIVKSRQGKTVEIHNTDAEGRLVLADALALAAEENSLVAARAIISVATLTGAIKVGLGVGMGGYFANDDALSEKIAHASQSSGDFMWEVPLFEGYTNLLHSQFADINHCSSSSFGGAITAALFLHSFVEPIKFAHFDIYAWNEGAQGALRETGGSGQAVQCLRELVKSI